MINKKMKADTNAVYSKDLGGFLGYSLKINVNAPTHERPLFWTSWQNNKLLAESEFLESLGFSLFGLFPIEFRQSIPAEVQNIAQSLPLYEFELMQAMLLAEEALQLAQTNPTLFLLLVICAQKNQMNEEAFLRLVKSKRTHILQRMGFEASNSLVNILARTQASFKYSSDIKEFTEVLRDPQKVQHLRHIKKLCVQHYKLLNLEPEVVWPGLFNMVGAQSVTGDLIQIVRLIRDSIQVGASIAQIRRLKELQALHTLHDNLTARFNQFDRIKQAQDYQMRHGNYPAAPLAGTEQIQPLTSWYELLEEGQVMHHCVGSYNRQVARKGLFVYRVKTASERLTLSIAHDVRGWYLDELRSYCNKAASEEVTEMVLTWLKARQEGEI